MGGREEPSRHEGSGQCLHNKPKMSDRVELITTSNHMHLAPPKCNYVFLSLSFKKLLFSSRASNRGSKLKICFRAQICSFFLSLVFLVFIICSSILRIHELKYFNLPLKQKPCPELGGGGLVNLASQLSAPLRNQVKRNFAKKEHEIGDYERVSI